MLITTGVAPLIGDVTLFRGFRTRAELLRVTRDSDRFDLSLGAGSEDSADPALTVGALAIMRADER